MSYEQKKPILFILLFSAFVLLVILIMQPLEIRYAMRKAGQIAILIPSGLIALKERNLLFFIQAIMLLVIIPVYILTFIFSWKYNAHNKNAKYDPLMEDSKLAEVLWWGIPFVFTTIIAVVTIYQTYQLDPFRPLKSDKPPLKIQVVALQWKWLFIYPEEKIATLNFLQFPKDVPLDFEITADAPMNSFWIPSLGGQIYAMPKMRSELHLIANEVGDFRGSSANISGLGFSDMHFIARASSDEDYQKWIDDSKQSTSRLNWDLYTQLALPSRHQEPQVYQLEEETLFEKILMKYMHPAKEEK
jgi:cytochrome o ubiquinol oxidase subunit 2